MPLTFGGAKLLGTHSLFVYMAVCLFVCLKVCVITFVCLLFVLLLSQCFNVWAIHRGRDLWRDILRERDTLCQLHVEIHVFCRECEQQVVRDTT